MLKRLFWDSEQRRITMLWRIILQALLFLILVSLFPMVAMIIITPMLTAQSGMSPDQLLGESDASPLISSPEIFFVLKVSMLLGTLLSVWLAGRFLDRRRFANFGFHLNRNWWSDLGFGLLLGAFLMAVIFLVEWVAGWITVTGTLVMSGEYNQPFLKGFVFSLLYFIAVGIQEELFSRGYQLKNLAEGLRGVPPLGAPGAIVAATLLSSALFGYLHIGNPNATFVSTFNIFLAGIFLAMGFILTGELAIPIGLHITWNFFQGTVFGFPVSGMASAFSIFGIEQGGDTLITGGMFGPEAGLIGIGAMVLGSILTIGWVKVRYGRANLYHALTQPDLLWRKGS